ncbi:MAG: glycosyltransferase, partial [Steroidobacteraceae bacterium]|nr:glycosyltransferase [Steroidobacteraceae bacterium]
MHDLARLASWPLAVFIVGGIAILPGMMNAFLVAGLLFDRRPKRKELVAYPGVTILVAAYNEEASIADTIRSLAAQNYPGEFEVLVIDDGS